MGSTDEDKMAWDDEKPQHEVTLEAYRIGKFPITNAQYAEFVAAGGYSKRRYWTTAGWERKERDGWTGAHDYGLPYTLAQHPVVGVSWYEATAFCCWLTEHLRESGELSSDETVELPTEEQWEKAARGTDGRIYPWGDEPDPTRANYSDTKIGTTSAVGSFPSGASPYGVEDMSGNVWEWCQTEWGSYE